jgi:RNA polymerase sigma-70 factor (ECF subfamily)
MAADEQIPTRASLLERLKDLGDEASWNEFYQTYRELIYSVARRAGLNEIEADEAVQDTLISVAKKMPGFTYDAAKDSFKGWLLRVTRWKIVDQFRKRVGVQASACPPGSEGQATLKREPQHTLKRGLQEKDTTATVERIPDPAGFDLEAIWDEEWEKNLLSAALARIKRQVHPQQYEIYHLHVILEKPVREVARTLGVSVTQVYLAKHRVGRLLKKEVSRLTNEPLGQRFRSSVRRIPFGFGGRRGRSSGGVTPATSMTR